MFQAFTNSLLNHLKEYLISEITLETITTVPQALSWISSTFLFQVKTNDFKRLLKNPTHYGLPVGLNEVTLTKKLQEIVSKDLKELEESKLICYDENNHIYSTNFGKTMVLYLISVFRPF